MRKEQGFTLIELLIVLAILGILIGIVAMSIGDLTTAARNRGMMSERETVLTAIDSWNTLDAIERPGDEVVAFGPEGAAVRLVKGATEGPDEFAEGEGTNRNFIKYLRRDTRYYYMYDPDAEDPLEELIVCNNADEDFCLKGGGAEYPDPPSEG